MTADALLSRHTAAWQAATVHPFLAGVRDGSVPEDCFDRWLAQDYRATSSATVAHCDLDAKPVRVGIPAIPHREVELTQRPIPAGAQSTK